MKTSIIILTLNNLEYTQRCIDSIRKYTDPSIYEIIAVDNKSTDGTREWLINQGDITSIINNENKGFPMGCNQGIQISNGDNILLLNNDTIVTKNWLTNLEKCLCSSGNIGAVGPVSNCFSILQTVETDYRSLEEMQKFAEKYNVSDPSKWIERKKLLGFCFLVKKEVVDKIGLLDERFSPGTYEDDDYSLRIRNEGYKLIVCRDTFIHHYGSITFKKSNFINANILQVNNAKFMEKWGRPHHELFREIR